MIIYIILVFIGFLILIKGADLFIDAISSVAINLKVSKTIIALTIVAFGTSAPEFAISINGMLNGNGDVVLANVIGSTVFNIMLVIGIASLIRPIKVRNETVKKELPLHLAIVIVLSILFLDVIFTNGIKNELTRSDGFILLVTFIIFLYYIFSIIKNKGANKGIKKERAKYKLWKSIIFSIIGLFAIFIGSDIAVENLSLFSRYVGVSDKFITMIVLVIGTSMPELIMSITAAKKREFDMLLGNIIGTNVFNIGFVLAIPIILFGSVSSPDFGIVDIIAVIISAIILYLSARNDRTVSKKEGILMLLIFLIYYSYIILNK